MEESSFYNTESSSEEKAIKMQNEHMKKIQ